MRFITSGIAITLFLISLHQCQGVDLRVVFDIPKAICLGGFFEFHILDNSSQDYYLATYSFSRNPGI